MKLKLKLNFKFNLLPPLARFVRNHMKTVTMLEFRRDAEAVIRTVQTGESLLLTYRGKPAVRLEPVEEDFKPYELVFNSEHPASVSFDENRLVVRLRFAILKTSLDEDEKPLENWDFLVTYQVTQRDNSIVLVRDGQIEVFPTGFDPRWDTRMTSKQVGYRNNLAKNINKKAARGEGFPAEIVVPELKLTDADNDEDQPKRTFQLQQLECDDGWLTIGYRVL